ncbi:MAG: ATP synthase subunit I [Clostridia bacterium]|nr:ATP synthase subunit I [Clostridia bacterium]
MFADTASKKEITYLTLTEVMLLGVMLAVFLAIGRFSLPVLIGGIVGTCVSLGNFVLMCLTLGKAVKDEDDSHRTTFLRMSQSLRMLGMFVIVLIALLVLKTNVISTLLPLLFPRLYAIFRNFQLRKEEKKIAEQHSEPESGQDDGEETE